MSHSNQGERFKCRTAFLVRVEVVYTSRLVKKFKIVIIKNTSIFMLKCNASTICSDNEKEQLYHYIAMASPDSIELNQGPASQ